MLHWEHFEHDADIGIRGVAPTLNQAFEQAAIALSAVVTSPQRIADVMAVDITCQADNNELLFLDWINEVIYNMAVRRMLFCRYQITIEQGKLTASAVGEKVNRQKHQPTVEIKGATFTELRVYQRPDGMWVAQCVVDV